MNEDMEDGFRIEMVRKLSKCMHEFLEQPPNKEYIPSIAVSEFLEVLDSIV